MLGLIREHRWFFLGTALAGLALRLFFFAYFPMVADDSRVYANIATNWLQHGVYGETQLTQILPTDARLPGYPAFLAAIFWLFGIGRIRAVLLVSIVRFDLATCLCRRRPCTTRGWQAGRENRILADGALSISGQLCRCRAYRDPGGLFYHAGSRLHGGRPESDKSQGGGSTQTLGRNGRGACGVHTAASRRWHLTRRGCVLFDCIGP